MVTPQDNIWILVPARGGSKGIPRKNLRLLGKKPLILHALDELSGVFSRGRIIVSTDSAEIAAIAGPLATIHNRTEEDSTDAATLDQVAVSICEWLLQNGANETDMLFTVQPTSPLIKAATIMRGAAMLAQGAGSVITVRDDRHLRWTLGEQTGQPKPLFEKRVNRQWLPPVYAETGGVIGARIHDIMALKTRLADPVRLIEVDDREGLDIDNYSDWAVAEYLLGRKKIMIRADGSPQLGMGHIYRAHALAQEFSGHDVVIVSRNDGEFATGAGFLSTLPYRADFLQGAEGFNAYMEDHQADIVILDILDTSKELMKEVRQHADFVVSIEDLGPGAQLADIVINDLYTDFIPQKNHWYGVRAAILSPSFEMVQPRNPATDQVRSILITFGGSDPQNLTVKALQALQLLGYGGKVIVVIGPGYAHPVPDPGAFELDSVLYRSVQNMALLMREADLAITSAGRTVTELMCLGVPTVVMCQNLREIRHTHASSPFGVMNLGLGEHINNEALANHISLLIDNPPIRLDMSRRALKATSGRSNKRICERIMSAVEGDSPDAEDNPELLL